ncbi:hypothetical protein V6Z12_A05G298500 [Gossypium hirsutum]
MSRPSFLLFALKMDEIYSLQVDHSYTIIWHCFTRKNLPSQIKEL